MEDTRYKGGTTPGGRWGCAIATLVTLPIFGVLLLVSTLGDCEPDVRCHPDILVAVILPCAIVFAIVGLGVRWLVNKLRRHGV
jgi:hypothetical protein